MKLPQDPRGTVEEPRHRDTSMAAADDDVRIRRQRSAIDSEPLGYVHSLDGLRAVALIAIILYHSHVSWIRGGFLALSCFFTLSGFLITALVLREWTGTSKIGLKAFWGRRFRRLLPAAWLTMSLIALAGLFGAWDNSQLRALRGDIPSALLQVLNWHYILGDRTYGAAFNAPSPMQHFWSLAAEEQFYLFLPLLVVLVLGTRPAGRTAMRRLQGLFLVFAAMILASSVLSGILARASIDRAYFGTDTRAAEMLAGSLLAVATVRRLRQSTSRGKIISEVVGFVSLAVLLALWLVAELRDPRMYPWGFLACALSSLGVIYAGLQGGFITRLFTLRPLPWLGRISYGIYLIHWPVFLILSPARTGLGMWPLLALRCALTLVLAVALYYGLESPIRVRKYFPQRGFTRYSFGSIIVVLALLGVSTSDIPPETKLEQALNSTATTTIPIRQLSVLVVGDQNAAELAHLLGGGEHTTYSVKAVSDCGVAIGGWLQLPDGRIERDVSRCRDTVTAWEAAIDSVQPDFVLIAPASRDALPRRFDMDETWPVAGDDVFKSHVSGLFVDTLTQLKTRAEKIGAQVVAVSSPPADVSRAPDIPPRAPGKGETEEKMLKEFDERISNGAPALVDSSGADVRLAATNAIFETAAELVGIRFLDLATRARNDAAGPIRLSDEALDDRTTLRDTSLRDWLDDELRRSVAEPLPAAQPPSSLTDVSLPDPPPARPRRVAPPGTPVRVLIAGDSVAVGLTFPLGALSKRYGMTVSGGGARLGCPISRGGTVKFQRDATEYGPQCDWTDLFPQLVTSFRPNVVLLQSGLWDVSDRRFPGDSVFRHIGDPLVDRFITHEFLSAVDSLSADGAVVALVLQPHAESGRDKGITGLPESDPARMDRLNELLREIAALRPDTTTLIDLRTWLQGQPGGEMSAELRPDGVHFDDASGPLVAKWLAPQLVAIGRGEHAD